MVGGVSAGVLTALLAAAVVGGLAVARIFRLNRRLRREVQERRAAEEKFRALVEQPSVGIFIARDGRFVYANSRFAEVFGYPVEEITGGLSAVDLAAEVDRERVRENSRRALEGDFGACEYGFAAIRKDGALVEVELNGRAVDFEGQPAIVGVALDVTAQNRDRRQLKYLAFYDPLTELPNRSLFYDRLGQALARGSRDREPFAVLMLDLDGFKAVNDVHGHETGDALLQAVGRRFRLCVRESDTVARMGGDEFVVLLTQLRDAEAASVVAGKLLAALDEPFFLGGRECRVGASIGICISPEDGEDMETLLSRADAAMYESKANGRNRFTRYREALTAGEPGRILHLDLGPELAVGVPVIDRQHARMAVLLNRVADAVKRGQERDRVTELLDELVAFTRHHFETEQRLMERHGYVEALAHAQEHGRLLSDLVSIRTHADGGSLMLTLQSLKEWLVSHIAHGDRDLGKALLDGGAAADSEGSDRAQT
jgi:diguanylate cyclase (GGDEF)-like protein/hemerythrin-like metal-binding protein/PAS domain S-box-containing protein